MGITRMGFYFLLEIQASFYFSHTGFRRFKISKKIFLKIQILDIIEKCIRWVLVCPFLGVFFGLKVQKGCAYVNVLKIALVLIKNVLLGLKKGISRLLSRIAAKHTASTRNLTDRFFLWKKKTIKNGSLPTAHAGFAKHIYLTLVSYRSNTTVSLACVLFSVFFVTYQCFDVGHTLQCWPQWRVIYALANLRLLAAFLLEYECRFVANLNLKG